MAYDVPKPPVAQQLERPEAAQPGTVTDGKITVPAAKAAALKSQATAKPPPKPKQGQGSGSIGRTPYGRRLPFAETPQSFGGGKKKKGDPFELSKEIARSQSAALAKLLTEAREEQPLARGEVELDSISNEELGAFVRQLAKDNPGFEARLKSDFARKALPALPAVALPAAAPRLWFKRPPTERGINPAAWIRLVYAPWLGHGLTRADIKRFDPALYFAYAQWIRPERHPMDAITFAPSHMFNAYADPVEATEQRRLLAREAKARQRAKARDDKLSLDV